MTDPLKEHALQQQRKVDLENLPSVEDLPVLPPMRSTMDADLAVNADGKLYVFHDKANPEDIDYVIYSDDDSTLHFVGKGGRLQDIGMIIQDAMKEYVRKARSIYFVHVENGQPGKIFQVAVVMHSYGT